MPLQFRRGTDAQRTTITPASGEPLWTTNTNRLYVGDGVTPGGVAVEIPLPSTGTFTSLTVTNIHFTGDPVGVNQTTAWTGTVAWSQIGSKPNGGLYTTSTVEFNQLSVTGSAITATQSSIFINASTATSYEPPHTTGYLLWGIEQSSSARLVTDTYSNTNGSVWTGRRARGTPAVPTALQTNDVIFRVAGTGYGTTEFENTSSGYIDVIATENFTDGAHGTKITLNTTNEGTNTPNTSLSVASDGTIITAPQVPATGSILTINQTGGTTYPAPPNAGQLVWGISNDAQAARMVIDNYSTSPFPSFLGRAGRGTAAAPTAVQADDTLLSVRANGYGTTGFNTTSSGFISFSAIENFTDTVRGTRMQIYATAPGDTLPNLVSTHRADGTFIYSTATTGNANAQLIVQGSYPNLTFEDAQEGTNILAVNMPGMPARVSIDTYANDLADNVDKSYLAGRRARGTASAPSAMQNGDSMLRVAGYAYGTTKFLSTASAGINFNVTENVTDNAAGGSITFDVLPKGVAPVIANQELILTIDQTGLTIENNLGLTATIATLDTAKVDDLYSKTLAGTITVHSPMAPTGTVNLGSSGSPWANIYGSTIVPTTLDFTGDPVGTVQTTAWTGTVANSQITSVSTSKVTGLSVVGWTNKYSDLTGGPNQALNTTDAVQFAGITDTGPLSVTGFSSLSGGATISAATVTNNLAVGTNLSAGATTLQSLVVNTGTQLTKTLSVGGYPLNAAGTSSVALNAIVSPTLFVSNTTPGQNANIFIRGFGQNNPNGGAATNPNPNLRLENAFGTNSAPTALTANQNIGGIIAGGYDGANWPADQSQSYNFLGWYATEAMTNSGTSTYQAGSGFNIYTQPGWTRPGINATRQRFIITSWTTATGGPSVNNILIGSGVDSTAPTMTMVDGTTYTGYGRANTTFINSYVNQMGVVPQDSAPDNATLTATNTITIIGNRRSGVSARRNSILVNDTLGAINFNGQNGTNSTGIGVAGAGISVNALDNFATARGTNITFTTVNTGTTQAPSRRLLLSDRLITQSADQYLFNNSVNTYVPLSFTTSTWNSSIDSMSFGNNNGTVTMLQLNTTDNNYNNTRHTFKDRSGITTALTLTTSSAVFGSTVVISGYKKCYGDFYNNNTTTFTINTGTAIALTPGTAANCSIQAGSQLLISQAGTYNLQFSAQIINADNGAEHDAWFWLRKNGADVAQSATKYTVIKQGANVAALTFNVTSSGSDYYEIMCAVNDTNVTLPSYAANSQGFPGPAIPAVIVNLIPVGA